MTKTYKISIPKFVDKQKKLDGKRQFIRLDIDIWSDPKISGLDPKLKLLYIFILTKLDEDGNLQATDKYIKKQLDLNARFDVESAMNVLSSYNLCTFLVQNDDNLNVNCMQNTCKIQKKEPTIYKDVLKERKEKKSKVKETEIACLEKTFDQDKAFERVWTQYPIKDGKKPARKHFLATVLTENDYIRIQKALNNYLNSSKVKSGYIKNGSTWFNQWTDFEQWTEPITNKTMADQYGTSELTIKNLKVLEEVFSDKRGGNSKGVREDGGCLQQTINQDDCYDVPGSFTGIE